VVLVSKGFMVEREEEQKHRKNQGRLSFCCAACELLVFDFVTRFCLFEILLFLQRLQMCITPSSRSFSKSMSNHLTQQRLMFCVPKKKASKSVKSPVQFSTLAVSTCIAGSSVLLPSSSFPDSDRFVACESLLAREYAGIVS